jgi:UDP-N-acetylmuramoyl-tripeptide--D-alanyl-D-alanine ligase
MITMTLREIADAVGGVVSGDATTPVTAEAFVDSRAVVRGGLFVAVEGERTDGHRYAEAAVAAGAAAVLGSRPTGVPTVVVEDPVAALGRLARQLLDRLPELTVLALTGSQGKTGTKDYLAQVLSDAGETVATTANHNNEIGVPLTVLRASAATRYLVVEMGARGVHQVEYLCRIAPPRVGAVLNVGTAHLGEFGSRESIARAKGELVEALPPDGVAVINADDPLTARMAGRTQARVVTFGRGGDVAWRDLALDELGRPDFELGYAGRWFAVRLDQPGEHQVANATAAAAMAVAVGLPAQQVAGSLSASHRVSRWRMELTERRDGLVVINDAYNANPDSMAAALGTLASIGSRTHRRTVAVLGEMRELGHEEATGHRWVGETVGTLGVDVLVTVGPVAALIAEGASTAPGGWAGASVITAGRDEAVAWVRENVTAGDIVLVKASRGAALEVVADALVADEEASTTGAEDSDRGRGQPGP